MPHEAHVTMEPVGSTRERACVGVQAIVDADDLQEALRESEERFRSLVENIGDVVISYDLDLRYRYVSPQFSRFMDADPQSLIGRTHREAGLPGDLADLLDEALRRSLASGKAVEVELAMPGEAGGRIAQTRAFPMFDADGRPSGVVTITRDAPERKRAEQEIELSRQRLSLHVERTPLAVIEFDLEGRVREWNPAAARVFGYQREDVVGRHWTFLAPAAEHGKLDDTWAALVGRQGGGRSTNQNVTKDGRPIDCEWFNTPLVGPGGATIGVASLVQDVTERAQANERLAAAANEWRETFDAMRDSVAVFDAGGVIVRCNAATTELTGRGYEQLIGRPCYEVFHGSDDFVTSCPQRRAFETLQAETSTLLQDGRWLRVTFAPHVDAEGGVTGGVHVVTDVSELKQTEDRLRDSIARQQRITEGVIAALSRSVEVRDPYTAGHERRVSELAVAIARSLHLGEDFVARVRVAGSLHDVGKITIPAEILSKPGRLSEMEFALIKGHPKAAYDILRPIEFEFPLADIVVQHHERLDGSGYPAGLAGDALLPEARILAVADVVEAMISHRPYRAALPLEAAIAEIEAGSGSRYDAAACEATIRLLRDQRFSFSE